MTIELEYCTGCKKQTNHDVEYKTKTNGDPWRDGTCEDCRLKRQLPVFDQNDDTFKMPFGKHKGQMLKEIPIDYLLWVSSNIGLGHSLRSRAKTISANKINSENIQTSQKENTTNLRNDFRSEILKIGLTAIQLDLVMAAWVASTVREIAKNLASSKKI